VLSVNGNTEYYDLNAATSNPDFNGFNLGTFCQGSGGIIFKGAEHNNYKCGGCDITSTQISYSVYLTSGPQASFSNRNIGFTSDLANGCGGSDQKWSDISYNDNIISGYSLPPGNYTLEVYSSQNTSCAGVQYASNGGANYKAYFTVAANVTYYRDADADGYGVTDMTQVSCTGAPVGYVALSGDCDDSVSSVHPGANEIVMV
jgi:hypothetical protein